jgi:transposase InsO family protein
MSVEGQQRQAGATAAADDGSLAQARVIISVWKENYNHRRRHSSLGYQARAAYATACTHR